MHPKTGQPFVIAGHGVHGSDYAGIYGMDLGFVATVHEGEPSEKMYVLFGDTWNVYDKDETLSLKTKPNGTVDVNPTTNMWQWEKAHGDSMAYVAEWTSDLPTQLRFSIVRPLDWTQPPLASPVPNIYAPIRVADDLTGKNDIFLGDWHTPNAAFATQNHLFALVWDVKTGLKYIPGFNFPQGSFVIARYDETTPSSFVAVKTLLQTDTPLGWIPPAKYGIANYPWTDRFSTPTCGTYPASAIKPLEIDGNILTRPVFVWGRQGFLEPTANGADTTIANPDFYLLVFDGDYLDEHGTIDAVYYFSGTAETPSWSPDWHDCTVVMGGSAELAKTSDGILVPTVYQMSACYDEQLGLWLALYGGHFPKDTKNLAGELVGDGVHLRSAPDPWGPWSSRVLIYSGGPSPDHCGTLYVPGSTGTGCVPPDFYGNPAVMGVAAYTDPGFEYGATIWRTVPTGSDTIDMYFALSTHNPYHVVMMKTSITKVSKSTMPPGG